MATRTWTGTSSTAWVTAGNWLEGAVPVNGDDVVFDWNATQSVAGSDQSAVTLASLKIFQTFGSSSILFGSNTTPLKVGVSGRVDIGLPSQSPATASGSQRINLDFAATSPTSVNVINSASASADTGKEVVRIKGSALTNPINVLGGTVGFATNSGDTATITTINVKSGTCNVGSGCTLTNLYCNGGTVTLNCAATLVETLSGSVTLQGSVEITTLTAVGGSTAVNNRAASGPSIGTLNLYGSAATVDFSGVGSALTITTFNVRAGTITTFSNAQLTLTNNAALDFDSSKTQFAFTTA